MLTRPLLAAPLLGLALLGAGCGSSNPTQGQPAAANPTKPGVTGAITVLAAASLQQTFTALGSQFQTAHRGTTITFSFAGSDTLAAQITAGAPADVFAAASAASYQPVVAAGDSVGTPTVFATNTLQIATPPGNPKHVARLADVTASGVTLDLCAPTVPCGAAAQKALTAAGLTATPVSEETAVTGVLTKVELGEVDAGLVYRTDVQGSMGKVDGVDFPEAWGAVTSYPIGVLTASKDKALAQAFVDYVRGPAGVAVLTAAGFRTP